LPDKGFVSSALVDSAPGHQETLKPPSGGFSFLLGANAKLFELSVTNRLPHELNY